MPQVDYDALAKHFGGTAAPPPSTGGAPPPDYDALAKHFGGTTAAPNFRTTNETDAQGLPTIGGTIKPELVALAKRADAEAAAAAERDKNWPADFASRLPRSLQYPVAAGLSLVQPAVEIAGVLAAAPSALRFGRGTTEALQPYAEAVVRAAARKIGVDPQELELAAARMRLDAARSQTRQAGIRADIAAASPPPAVDPAAPIRPGQMTPDQLAAAMAAKGQPQPPARAAAGVVRPTGATFANPTGAPDAAPPAVLAPPAAPDAVVTAPPSTPAAQSSAPPTPPRPANTWPDQRALNEQALAARRAAYQARQAELAAKGQPQPAPAPAAADLTVPEQAEYLRLRQAGQTHPQALDLVQAQRDFQAQVVGTPTPTPAQTQFPKGNRGKASGAAAPTSQPALVTPQSTTPAPAPDVAAPAASPLPDSIGARVMPGATTEAPPAVDWSAEMTRLQDTKPRSLAKTFGTKGPTPEQADAYAARVRDWNREYRNASKQQKIQLADSNAAFAAKQLDWQRAYLNASEEQRAAMADDAPSFAAEMRARGER